MNTINHYVFPTKLVGRMRSKELIKVLILDFLPDCLLVLEYCTAAILNENTGRMGGLSFYESYRETSVH